MAEKMPDARFEVIKDAGHWPQWEQHEVFNALAVDFLTGKRD